MAKIKRKYMRTLDGYLAWIPVESVFLRPALKPYDVFGTTAAEWMKRWESEGVELPATSEPEQLQRYMQGKVNRDWHISEWREGVRMGLFVPEEFIGTLGLTRENFAGVFGREPRTFEWMDAPAAKLQERP